MRTDDPRHGQERGYFAHLKHGESPCLPCRRAHGREIKRRTFIRAQGGRSQYDATGCKRRIQALVALGWSLSELDRKAGRGARWARNILLQETVYSTTIRQVHALYEQLCMTCPPETDRYERTAATAARNRAKREGWAPPLAWDDIDNDKAPKGMRAA